jgi:hypothetical protein
VSVRARAAILAAAFAGVAALGALVVLHYLQGGPPVEDFTSAGAGPVHVLLQEDAQNTVTSKPDWVSYFIQSPQTRRWVHTTLFRVPAGRRIDVTILGYDGCTPLRNPYWGEVTGTTGNVEYVNGKRMSVLNSWSGCDVGHTFSIPGIGLNAPMASPGLAANLCATSPCTSGPHTTMTFSFTAPEAAGDYFWQCRVPCGGGFLDGFGGPMQTIGFMTGDMEVS